MAFCQTLDSLTGSWQHSVFAPSPFPFPHPAPHPAPHSAPWSCHSTATVTVGASSRFCWLIKVRLNFERGGLPHETPLIRNCLNFLPSYPGCLCLIGHMNLNPAKGTRWWWWWWRRWCWWRRGYKIVAHAQGQKVKVKVWLKVTGESGSH